MTDNTFAKTGIRIASGTIAVMVLFFVLISSLFITVHADHDCTGEDCPVCECMHQCENNIRMLGSGLTALEAVIIPVFELLLFISFTACLPACDTPVSRKVRLNN